MPIRVHEGGQSGIATVVGSVAMLLGFLFLYQQTETFDFIALAKSCGDKKRLKNIYFATNKEYYFWGGFKENPDIRIFDLYNPDILHSEFSTLLTNFQFDCCTCVLAYFCTIYTTHALSMLMTLATLTVSMPNMNLLRYIAYGIWEAGNELSEFGRRI